MDTSTSYLRRGALALGAVSLGGYLVDYGFNLGLTRFLTPHGSKSPILSPIFSAWPCCSAATARRPMLAPCLERGETRKVWEYLRFYLGNATWLGLSLIAVTWTLSAFHAGSSDPLDHHPIAWVVVAVPLNAAAAMISRTLQSARRPAQAMVPWRFGLPLLQLAMLGTLVAIRGRLTVTEAVLVGVVATGLITLWQWHTVRRLELVEIVREPGYRDPRAWLGASLPMMGTFLVALALSQSDLYFLELL